jgi:hypothetical protein
MFVAAVALGAAWALFHAWRPATFVLTESGGRPPLAPLYAFVLPAVTPWVVAVGLVIAAGAWLAGRLARARPALFLAFAFAFAAALAFSVHAARSGTLPGRELAFYEGEEILEDARSATSAASLLRTYTERQPRLSLHGRTKPPGFALLYLAALSVFPDSLPVLGALLTLIGSLIVLPTYALSRLLDGDEARARAGALLAAAAPPAVLFGAVSLDAVFATVAGCAFALTAWEIARPSTWKRAALGIALFATLMLSYSGLVVLLLCSSWLALERWRRPREFVRDGAQIALVAAAAFLLVRLASGFDAWTCFENARRLNAHLMTRVIGRPIDSPAVLRYASIGNALAFAIALGPALVGTLALLRRADVEARPRALGWSAAVAFIVACVGGIYLIETERIFLFFVPVIAVLAARVREAPVRVTVVASAATALAFELALFTLW